MDQMSFDKEKAYDAEIAPLVAQILALAKEYQIPMMAVFQLSNEEEYRYADAVLAFAHQSVTMDRIQQAAVIEIVHKDD